MSFDRRGQGWRVVFRDCPSNRRLPRVIMFTDPDKIRNLYQRFGSRRMSEDVAAFEFAIESGRGQVELTLGVAEYAKLQTEKAPPVMAGL